MSRNEKTPPLPVDLEAEQFERNRRAELNGSAPYQRGRQQAESNEKSNRRGELTQGLADLKRVTLNRDTTQAGRDSYDRTWKRVYAMAQRFATGFGESVAMPNYLPPPVATAADTLTVEPGAPPDGRYKETRGMGPNHKGLPLRGPGSNTDPNWVTE